MYINDSGKTIPMGRWGDTYYNGLEPFNAIYEVAPASVPEPGTMLLLSAGLIGLGVTRKRFKTS